MVCKTNLSTRVLGLFDMSVIYSIEDACTFSIFEDVLIVMMQKDEETRSIMGIHISFMFMHDDGGCNTYKHV